VRSFWSPLRPRHACATRLRLPHAAVGLLVLAQIAAARLRQQPHSWQLLPGRSGKSCDKSVNGILAMPPENLITIPSGSTRLTVAFLYSLPLSVLKSSAKATDGKRMTEIRMLKKKREVMHKLLAIGPNRCKLARGVDKSKNLPDESMGC
jgi:hypothetical protein